MSKSKLKNGQVEVNGQSFEVDDGIITSRGKFEGEMNYTPHFWDIINDGGYNDFVSYWGKTIYRVRVNQNDRKKFAGLNGQKWVYYFERDDGFVVELDWDEGDWKNAKDWENYICELHHTVNHIEKTLDYFEVVDDQKTKMTAKINTKNLRVTGCIPPKIREGLRLEKNVIVDGFWVDGDIIKVELTNFYL